MSSLKSSSNVSNSSASSSSRRSSYSTSAASQRSLPPPPGLRVLSLANNGLGDDGAAALVGACVRGGITHLNLAMNKVSALIVGTKTHFSLLDFLMSNVIVLDFVILLCLIIQPFSSFAFFFALFSPD